MTFHFRFKSEVRVDFGDKHVQLHEVCRWPHALWNSFDHIRLSAPPPDKKNYSPMDSSDAAAASMKQSIAANNPSGCGRKFSLDQKLPDELGSAKLLLQINHYLLQEQTRGSKYGTFHCATFHFVNADGFIPF